MATFLKNGKFIISTDPAASAADFEVEDLLEKGPDAELREIKVPEELHAQRVDTVLARQISEFSRSYLQQLIEAGLVRLRGMPVRKPAARVNAGDSVAVELRPTPQTQAFRPEAMPLEVVYEDEHLLVINKPTGLVVHPAPGNWSGTLLNGLLGRDPLAAHLPRAGIVHRLDKDTSGLMVVARSRLAMDRLIRAIAARAVRRQYLAVGHRRWRGNESIQVNAAIGRDPRNRLRMAVVDLGQHAGKSALTDIRLIENAENCCLVECSLQTGRTHQIRVHMASLGHPLVGDGLYGGSPLGGLERQALHAYRLAFAHPVSAESLTFTAPVPADMESAFKALGLRYNAGSD